LLGPQKFGYLPGLQIVFSSLLPVVGDAQEGDQQAEFQRSEPFSGSGVVAPKASTPKRNGR
jgi:hypothetical protein